MQIKISSLRLPLLLFFVFVLFAIDESLGRTLPEAITTESTLDKDKLVEQDTMKSLPLVVMSLGGDNHLDNELLDNELLENELLDIVVETLELPPLREDFERKKIDGKDHQDDSGDKNSSESNQVVISFPEDFEDMVTKRAPRPSTDTNSSDGDVHLLSTLPSKEDFDADYEFLDVDTVDSEADSKADNEKLVNEELNEKVILSSFPISLIGFF